MSKHTPGPWTVGASGISPIAVCADSRVLAHVNITGYKFPSEGDKANANLIAAAPDLLAALIEAEKYCPVSVQDRIRVAIRKATGEG